MFKLNIMNFLYVEKGSRLYLLKKKCLFEGFFYLLKFCKQSSFFYLVLYILIFKFFNSFDFEFLTMFVSPVLKVSYFKCKKVKKIVSVIRNKKDILIRIQLENQFVWIFFCSYTLLKKVCNLYWKFLVNKSSFINLNGVKLRPLLFFEDFFDQKIIKRLRLFGSKNRETAGVYFILNKINGNFYVGSTSNFYKRFKDHCFNEHKGKGSTKIYFAIKKYGINNFSFGILFIFPGKVYEKEILLKIENSFIRTLSPYYNILKNAGSSLGYKHTVDAIANIKKNQPNAKKGILINVETKSEIIFDSIKAVAAFIGCRKSTVQFALKRGNLIYGKWLVKLFD